MNGEEAYVLSKALTAAATAGIKSYNISDTGLLTMVTADGQTLTYQFREPEDGVDGVDGISIVNVDVDNNKHLVITYSDGRVETTPGIVPTVKGDKGDTGNDGKSFSIKAQYVTYDALIAAHPTGNVGDAYFVGSDANPDLYIWLEETYEWFNNGPIVGVKGDDGFSPSVELERKSAGVEITVTNESGSESAMVYDGKGGGADLQDELTAAISVGGIASGTVYEEGTSLETIFRDMLEPTLYPTLTAPSASMTATGVKLLETGSTLNTTFTIVLNRGSINPQYSAESSYRCGAASSYTLDGTSQAGNTFSITITEAKKTYQGSVAYEAGVQPKDSKGNNYGSPLSAGSVNTNTINYEFVDALWANTANIATVAKLALVSKSAKLKEFNFPAQTASNPEEFHVPASWTITAVEVLNTLSNQWENCAGEFTVTDTTHENAGGTAVNYKKYLCNLGVATGSRKIRIKWS